MTTLMQPRPTAPQIRSIEAYPFVEDARVYAIAFDMDTDTLQRAYTGTSWNNAYSEIQKVLSRHGFTRQQGGVYFGSREVNAVTCVLAAMDLSQSLPWFAISVRDIRMLRIEEQNDLLPAVERVAPSTEYNSYFHQTAA